jgi:hypothetical protein
MTAIRTQERASPTAVSQSGWPSAVEATSELCRGRYGCCRRSRCSASTALTRAAASTVAPATLPGRHGLSLILRNGLVRVHSGVRSALCAALSVLRPLLGVLLTAEGSRALAAASGDPVLEAIARPRLEDVSVEGRRSTAREGDAATARD